MSQELSSEAELILRELAELSRAVVDAKSEEEWERHQRRLEREEWTRGFEAHDHDESDCVAQESGEHQPSVHELAHKLIACRATIANQSGELISLEASEQRLRQRLEKSEKEVVFRFSLVFKESVCSTTKKQ